MKVLFSLRKEFVDDLLNLGAAAMPNGGQLFDLRFRFSLRNWSYESAKAVLAEVAEREGLRFSPDLQTSVIRDLAANDQVRPVEFQLVLTHLNSVEIYDTASYRGQGGARGVLSGFIQGTIDQGRIQSRELETRIAKNVLRSLCDETLTARRPVGKEPAELRNEVLAQISDSHYRSLLSSHQFDDAFDSVVRRLEEAFILIRESGDRINLAHDYLVPSVRDTTADVSTAEEEANRLLEQFVSQRQRGNRAVIPLSEYRFIRRHAAKDAQAETTATVLFKEVRRRFAVYGAGIIGAAGLILGIILPFGPKFTSQVVEVGVGKWMLSSNAEIGVRIARQPSVWFLGNGSPFSRRFTVPDLKRAWIDDDGETVLLMSSDGHLFRLLAETGYELEQIPFQVDTDSVWGWDGSVAGVSPSGSWFLGQNAGKYYIWPRNGTPKLTVQRQKYKRYSNGNWGTSTIRFSPDENAVFIHGQGDSLLRKALDGAATIAEIPVPHQDEGSVQFIGEGQYFLSPLNFEAGPEGETNAEEKTGSEETAELEEESEPEKFRVGLWKNVDTPTLVASTTLSGSGRLNNSFNWRVSPDGRWVVLRRTFQSFHTLRIDQEELSQLSGASIDIETSSSDSSAQISFSPDSKFVSGIAQDRLLYVWSLANPPRTNAVPVDKSESIGFGGIAPIIEFSQDSQSALVRTVDGSVLVGRSTTPKPFGNWTKIGRVPPLHAQFRSTVDAGTFFLSTPTELFIVENLDSISSVIETSSNLVGLVDHVTKDRMTIICENHLLVMEKWFHIFGFPIWKLDIPALADSK